MSSSRARIARLTSAVELHVRAITGRRQLRDAPASLDATADLRALATPSYLLFPATTVIMHPDFTSVITLYPLAADQSACCGRRGSRARGHRRQYCELGCRLVRAAQAVSLPCSHRAMGARAW